MMNRKESIAAHDALCALASLDPTTGAPGNPPCEYRTRGAVTSLRASVAHAFPRSLAVGPGTIAARALRIRSLAYAAICYLICEHMRALYGMPVKSTPAPARDAAQVEREQLQAQLQGRYESALKVYDRNRARMVMLGLSMASVEAQCGLKVNSLSEIGTRPAPAYWRTTTAERRIASIETITRTVADYLAGLAPVVVAVMCALWSFMPSAATAAPVSSCVEPSARCAAILEIADNSCNDGDAATDCRVDRRRIVEAVEVCREVEKRAIELGADVELSIVTAYRESGLQRFAVGAAGEIGAMQITPRYHCGPEAVRGFWRMCDPIVAGVVAVRDLVDRYGPEVGIAYYKAGRRAFDGVGIDGARSRVELADRLRGAR